mmetsp:Transcript_55118/g.172848  ORF Transcript_55118/g.172848 Transcript_55118/m.172848 type:complete len:261 (-) Transcript_55118:283-1065(-)
MAARRGPFSAACSPTWQKWQICAASLHGEAACETHWALPSSYPERRASRSSSRVEPSRQGPQCSAGSASLGQGWMLLPTVPKTEGGCDSVRSIGLETESSRSSGLSDAAAGASGPTAACGEEPRCSSASPSLATSGDASLVLARRDPSGDASIVFSGASVALPQATNPSKPTPSRASRNRDTSMRSRHGTMAPQPAPGSAPDCVAWPWNPADSLTPDGVAASSDRETPGIEREPQLEDKSLGSGSRSVRSRPRCTCGRDG